LHKSQVGERKERKNYASSKKLLTSIKEKEPLGKKSPFTKVGEIFTFIIGKYCESRSQFSFDAANNGKRKIEEHCNHPWHVSRKGASETSWLG